MLHHPKCLLLLLLPCLLTVKAIAQPIDRKALVERHKVIVNKMDTLSSLSVGNGKFAFTVDATGLQSFPRYYANGVPLGTQSEWGWHSFPDTAGYKVEESFKTYHFNGRDVLYAVQTSGTARQKAVSNWFRENPHRLQLGNLGFILLKKDGSEAQPTDLKNIHQELNPWTGAISSHFELEGEAVNVITYGHQTYDAVAAKVTSALIKQGRLKISLRFPFPSNAFADMGVNYNHPEKHSSTFNTDGHVAVINHKLDDFSYNVVLNWTGNAIFAQAGAHRYILSPDRNTDEVAIGCYFAPISAITKPSVPNFEQTKESSIGGWQKFWLSGGAVDLSGSTDPRAFELERRIILSQYLTKIQCAGAYPPQETGLTYNSWYGKPHLEMHWWHGVHFAFWGRPDLLAGSLAWYASVEDKAKAIAARQGYSGARWQKMTDPAGDESPSSVGALLIWQQPHFIYMAELEYRAHPTKETLDKYKEQVFATANFMASFAHYDTLTGHYNLGKGLIPSQEVHKAEDTYNPPYELVYWQWALSVAQRWRQRAGLTPNAQWQAVIDKIAPLPQQNGVYLEAASAPDSYTNPKNITDHPSVFAAYGMMPLSNLTDTAVMHQTYSLIMKTWNWPKTWGWDFPMTAMTATRLGMPDKAIDALFMPVTTNTYLNNGHNYQDDRLTIYLPGNGGLLTAIAMMCAGWDGCTTTNPGFPKNGQWHVRWEGLQKMP